MTMMARNEGSVQQQGLSYGGVKESRERKKAVEERVEGEKGKRRTTEIEEGQTLHRRRKRMYTEK